MATVSHKNLTGANIGEAFRYVQASDPGAVGAGKYWLDTTGDPYVLKRRNPANSGWIVVGSDGTPLAHASSHENGGSDEIDLTGLSGVPADVQPLDATLTAFAALTIAANSITIGTGADAFSQVTIGANKLLGASSNGILGAKLITDFGFTLVGCADASTARETLELQSMAVQGANAVAITGGTINGTVIGGSTPAAGTFTSLQATGNLVVDGNLTVSGTTVTMDTATITVEDPLIKLAKANSGDAVDVGFYAQYTSSGTRYAGLFRDATDGKFKLFTSLQDEPTTTVNTAGTDYYRADLQVQILEADILRVLDGDMDSYLSLLNDQSLAGNKNLTIRLLSGNSTNITIGNAPTINGGTHSGTNTGDQFTSTTESRLLGRGQGSGAGAAQEISLGTGLSLSGTTLSATGYIAGGTDVSLADGGTGASLADPGADRIMFWDYSAGEVTWLTVGSGLSITGTTLSASGGGGSGDVVGPASSTDNGIPRYDGTTGKLLQTSSAIITDGGVLSTTGASLNYAAANVVYLTPTAKSANFTVDQNASGYICDCTGGAITATLPAVAGLAGLIYVFKKIDSSANALTIDGNGSETIDGDTTLVLSYQYSSVTLYCDGTSWHII